MFDPEGKGHHGHEGIGRCWDLPSPGLITSMRAHGEIDRAMATIRPPA